MYNDEFQWLIVLFFICLSMLAFYILVTGEVNIDFTGSSEINELTKLNKECNEQLESKCEPCPVVQCVGDMSFPLFMIGLFIGFIAGNLFIISFGKKIKELFMREYKPKGKKQ